MKAAPFAYRRPATLNEAVAELADPEAKALAGGQSLVPMMVMRLARPHVLVDLADVSELGGVTEGNGSLHVGAMVRQRDAERDPLVAARVPLLAAALPFVGHREIRNRGTIGGSIAHADPAAELGCIAATLGATLHVSGAEGTRNLGAREFVTGAFQTRLSPGELLTGVEWPVARDGEGFAFHEVARRHGDFALCGVAVRVRRSGERVDIADAGLLGVADRPVVLDAAGMLDGDDPTRFTSAAKELAAGLNPSGDLHASAAYRCHLAVALLRRCFTNAFLATQAQR